MEFYLSLWRLCLFDRNEDPVFLSLDFVNSENSSVKFSDYLYTLLSTFTCLPTPFPAKIDSPPSDDRFKF